MQRSPLLLRLLALLVLSAVAATALAQDATEQPTATPPTQRAASIIRVGHFATATAPVDLYVNGTLTAEAVAYGTFSDYTPLADEDEFTIQVVLSGEDPAEADLLADETAAVDAGSDVNVYLVGAEEASLEVIMVAYTLGGDLLADIDTLSSLLVYHFAEGTDVGSVSYTSEVLATALDYTDDAAVAVRVTPEPVRVVFLDPNDNEIAAATLTLVPGGDYVVVLYGAPGGLRVAASGVDLLTGEALPGFDVAVEGVPSDASDADATAEPAA